MTAHRTLTPTTPDRMSRRPDEEATYGMCEVCLKPIPTERLGPVPFATRCTACTDSRHRHRVAQADMNQFTR